MPVAPTPVEAPAFVELTKQEEQEVRTRITELRKLLDSQKDSAKYKIEIRLMHKRSTWKPVPGFVSFWKSGNRLHGGGDEKVYMCPGKKISKSDEVVDCDALLSDDERTLKTFTLGAETVGDIVCPKCGQVWMMEQLIGEKFFVLTPQNWAVAIVRMFIMCGHDADIVLKYSPDDIRSIATKEQERQRGGELLLETRNWRKRRGTAIYRLASIIKDTANGADIQKRFYTFITV